MLSRDVVVPPLNIDSRAKTTAGRKGSVAFATFLRDVRKIRKDRNEISLPTELIIVRSTFTDHIRRSWVGLGTLCWHNFEHNNSHSSRFLGLYIKSEGNFAEPPT